MNATILSNSCRHGAAQAGFNKQHLPQESPPVSLDEELLEDEDDDLLEEDEDDELEDDLDEEDLELLGEDGEL